jgi:tetratricopeptide (TPR) repeat protein
VDIQNRVKFLQQAEFLIASRASPGEFTFRHALTHDVAYAGLLQEQRKQLHAATSSAIERLYHDRLAEHVEALARHAVAGEMWPSATNYLRQAGRAAAMRSNYNDATAWHRTALDACRHLGASKDVLALEIEIRFKLYNALLAIGDYTPIFEVLREAERLAVALGDARRLSRIHGYTAMSMWWVGDYESAIDLATRAAATARELRRPGLEGIALVALGWSYHSLGKFDEASASLTRVLDLAKAEPDRFAGRRGSPPLSVMALVWLAILKGEQGVFDVGYRLASDAVRLAEEADHPWSRAAAYFGQGALLIAQDKAAHAISVLEQGLRLCEKYDISSWRMTMAWHLGYACVCARDLDRGVPLLEDAVQSGTSSRCCASQSMRVGWLAEAFLFANQPERAGQLAQEALRLAEAYGELPAQAHIHRILGDIFGAQLSGRSTAAFEHYKAARSLSEKSLVKLGRV